MSSGAAVGVRSVSVTGVQYAVQLEEATAKAHLDALLADARPGCPAFQSATDNGATQTVTLVAVLPLQPAADQGLAFEKAIQSSTGRVIADEVVLRRGPTISVLVLFTATGLDPNTVAALATAMGTHLAQLG